MKLIAVSISIQLWAYWLRDGATSSVMQIQHWVNGKEQMDKARRTLEVYLVVRVTTMYQRLSRDNVRKRRQRYNAPAGRSFLFYSVNV